MRTMRPSTKIFEHIAVERVNIIAFSITNRMNANFVRMVAGPPNSNSSFANMVKHDIITRTKDNKNFVMLVPGTNESESKRDLQVVRKLLLALKIRINKEKIIIISNSRLPAGIQGGYSNLYNRLWCRVEVKSWYLGEGEFIYLNVSNLKKH